MEDAGDLATGLEDFVGLLLRLDQLAVVESWGACWMKGIDGGKEGGCESSDGGTS